MSLWLAKDQRSNEVVALQNALNIRLKPAKPLALDGIFGPHTEAAVREFQKCEELKADGIAGPRTLCALFVLRTVTRTFVLTLGAPPGVGPKVGAARGVDATVASPYDPPSLPPDPKADPNLSLLLQRWHAWRRAHPPKPELPDAPPLLPLPPSDDTVGKTKTPPPSPSDHRRGRLWRLDGKHPHRFGLLSKNEWLELEWATEFSKKLHHKIEIEQSVTAAFVKGAPYAVPSVSGVLSPNGEAGLRASVKIMGKPIVEHILGRMAGETGRVALLPALDTSLMWHGGKKFSFDIFGGLRAVVGWNKEWHGARGRVHVIDIFTAFAAGALIVGEEEGKGRFQVGPSFGMDAQVGVSYALGTLHQE
jgi:hypothetical protein